jgi:cytochrome c peroxidase
MATGLSVKTHPSRRRSVPWILALAFTAFGAWADDQSTDLSQLVLSDSQRALQFLDASGVITTQSRAGFVDFGNEFFQDLGANGRRCVSCHLPSMGWTITPAQVRVVFALTVGGARRDPFGLGAIFRTNDGSNSPNAPVATLAQRRAAYSMLLSKGLIRVGLPIPAAADFALIAVDDPYGFASASELSLFRRPLPSTNLDFLSTVMWDGRETLAGSDHCNIAAEGGKCFASIHMDLADQSNSATQGHAQAPLPLSVAQRESIVAFETQLATAQSWDRRARDLSAFGARGGPQAIFDQRTYYGINDNLGDYVTGAPFTTTVFNLFANWAFQSGDDVNEARRSIARGEVIFNSRQFTIAGVAGLNTDSPFNPPLPASFQGTCTTCHNTPNGGNHSIVAPLNIGLVDASRRTPDMPLYTLQQKCITNADGSTSVGPGCRTQVVTDPGRALISGKFADIGKFKGPVLRGLAARAPYFHNGFAATLGEVVDFYNDRFGAGITGQDREDLIAFLQSL